MAVAFDATSTQIGTSTVVGVCTMTIAANACLIVGVSVTTNLSVSACYAGATPMTQLGRVIHSVNNNNVTLFGITAAPSGVVSISANFVGGGAGLLCMHAVSYTGQRQANPFGVVKTGTATNVNNFALSYSTSTTDMLMFFCAGTNGVSAVNATRRQLDGAHLVTIYADTAGPASTFSLSCTAVITTNNLAFLGVNIAAFSAASLVAGGICMQGVGL